MEINKISSNAEELFNRAGSIPIAAIVSSCVRCVAAKVQILVSVFFGLFGLVGQIVSSNPSKYENMAKKAGEHIIHGGLNWLRGVGEFVLATTVVGSLVLLAYQLRSEKGFTPIPPYTPDAPASEEAV